MNKFIYFLVIIGTVIKFSFSAVNWNNIGGPSGGYLSSIVILPNNYIYVGEYNRGIYLSIDNGQNWTNIFNEGIWTLNYDSNNTIFAGTREGNIYRLLDEHSDWERVASELDERIDKILVDSNNYIFATTWDNGVFRSMDGGDKWEKITNENFKKYTSIGIHPNGNLYISNGTGLYISENNGDSLNYLGDITGNLLIHEITITPNGYIFAACTSRNSTSTGGVFVSKDDGFNWEKTGLVETSSIFSITSNSTTNIFTIEGGTLYQSTDYGLTWDKVKSPLTNLHMTAILQTSSNEVFVTTDGNGIFKSNDDFFSWQSIGRGLPYVAINELAVNSNGYILAGADEAGVWVSRDNGISWDIICNGLSYNDIEAICIDSKGSIYVGTWWGGIFKSDNNGEIWNNINSNMFPVRSMVIDTSDNIIAGTHDGVYVSSDYGITWQEILDKSTYKIAFNFNNVLFAGGYNWVKYSNDLGKNWESFRSPIWELEVLEFGFNKINDIYIGTNIITLKSEDSGETLQEVFNKSMRAFFRSSSNVMYFALEDAGINDNSEIYISEDDGLTFIDFSEGISGEITSFEVDKNGYLLAGTKANGIFRSKNIVTDIRKHQNIYPQKIDLFQNYPNPFNPKTTISFYLPKSEYVSIEIFNSLGQRIRNLVSERISIGNHKVTFNGSELTNGLYFYKITVGNFSDIKKMLLIK